MVNAPHRHHVVPKHYLRAFAIPDQRSHIWQYRVGDPISRAGQGTVANPKRLALKVAGQREHFYSFSIGNNIDSVTFESELKKREDKYIPSLSKLRSVESLADFGRFLAQHREDFVECIMVMHQRGFRRRDILERLLARIDGDPRFPILSEGEKRRLMHESMLNMDHSIKELLLDSSWLYFRAPRGKEFITSDSPVYADLGGLGMLTFPVSPKYVLAVARKDCYGENVPCHTILDATEESWSDLNCMVARGAVQHLYHGKNEEWISRLSGRINASEESDRMVQDLLSRFNSSESANLIKGSFDSVNS